uniref:Odorant receptor n=1 Tax=Campoletis chlorideae TaxID=219166 RepID=A0A346D3Y3_9HYME|nr:odorant receptor [Campoletis chlorideae]
MKQDEVDRAKDLFIWNERFFALAGVWPLQSTYGKFAVWAIYYLLHIIMQTADLISVFGDLELVIQNLSESMLQVLIFIKLVVLRFSHKVKTLIKRVAEDIDAKHLDSPEEKEIYLTYNRMSKTFFKVWVTMGFITAIGYYLKPLQLQLESASQNGTMPYVLAYRVRLFFEIKDPITYYLAWLYQAPVMYMGVWHTAAIGFLFSLVLHVCGQLSVLSFKIKHLNLQERQSKEAFRSIFKEIVVRHRKILECVLDGSHFLNPSFFKVLIFFFSTNRLAKDINDIFGLILVEELILSTVLIGLTCYAALVNIDTAEGAEVFSFVLYGATLLFLVYGYCAAGEHLITESTNLYAAYYHCLWYNMPDYFKKQLIICMIGASRPIQLTAGGIYTFSLVSFMGVVKTAAGYISMLRTMV